MQKASDKIEDLEHLPQVDPLESEFIDDTPFSEAKVTIVSGDQRSGKTCYAVGKVVDAYRKDCVRVYCEQVLKINCEVIAYYKQDRVAKIKVNGQTKLIQIPTNYKLVTPLRIFSNIHLYGVRYVYIPSFYHLAKWLKLGIISNGWLIMDEAHVGMGARAGMTKLGQDLVVQCMQLGKSKLEVLLITHIPRLIDWVGRMIPTRSVHCTYDEKKRVINFTLKKKGEPNPVEHHFDATQYWPNYRSNEKVNK
jgi:hypothetical protein